STLVPPFGQFAPGASGVCTMRVVWPASPCCPAGPCGPGAPGAPAGPCGSTTCDQAPLAQATNVCVELAKATAPALSSVHRISNQMPPGQVQRLDGEVT